jgi:hypothetical protein
VSSEYCGDCLVTGWMASGPYSGSWVPATLASLCDGQRMLVQIRSHKYSLLLEPIHAGVCMTDWEMLLVTDV